MRRSFLSSPTWRARSGAIPNGMLLAPLPGMQEIGFQWEVNNTPLPPLLSRI
jgi:hypothetical protein